MPVAIERIEGQPIIVSTFTGHIHAEDLADYFGKLKPILDAIEGHIYLVSYIPSIEYTADDLLGLLHYAKPQYAAVDENPAQTLLFVATSALVHVYKEALAKPEFGGVTIPMFTTLEEAFTHIEGRIAESNLTSEV